MQFNIYVPKEKEHIIRALVDVAKSTHRQKNELVLEALERYLPEKEFVLGKFNLGDTGLPDRSEIYEDRLER